MKIARATSLALATAAVGLFVLTDPVAAHEASHAVAGDLLDVRGPTSAAPDSAGVAEVVDRFHVALAAGDTATVLRLLAGDVVVQESGGVETLDEYRSHHLPGDMAFARAVKRERSPIRVQVRGDVAWATSTSTTVGEYRGRAIDAQGAELMVLRRDPEGWRIVAIHWSSRNRRS